MTIVGNGDIARAIPAHLDRADWCWFASGVSFSGETRREAFDREWHLLTKQPHRLHLVYFSTLSIFYADSPYTRHKLGMETVVRERFMDHTIVRLGNITWGDNPRTLINTLQRRAFQGLPLDIQPVYRYVCDRDEFQHWLGMIPDWPCEMNIPGQRLTVQQIVDRYVTPYTWEKEPVC